LNNVIIARTRLKNQALAKMQEKCNATILSWF
jgi:hypothetical protein